MVFDDEAGEGVPDEFGDFGGAMVGSVRQEGDELFAAETGDLIDITKIVAQAPCGLVENGVSTIDTSYC